MGVWKERDIEIVLAYLFDMTAICLQSQQDKVCL